MSKVSGWSRRIAWSTIAVLLAAAVVWPSMSRAYAGETSAGRGLRVIPFPGTPDASPHSSIIFSSLRRSDIVSVTVAGSHSGGHTGRLEVLPDGAGTAFVPGVGFSAGERVRVEATLSSLAAGAAAGDPNATTVAFSFTVAAPAPSAAPARRLTSPAAATGRAAAKRSPQRHFVSEPDLHPPVVTMTTDGDRRSGDIFLTPYLASESGLMILSSEGQLVWFAPRPGRTGNLAVQRYQGQPVLTWWQRPGSADGRGADVIMSRSYRTVAVVQAGYGYETDMHEFQITPKGTALLDADVPVRSDLSGVGGPSAGAVNDCVIQEVDVNTGQVLWEWHALGHVPLRASYTPIPKPPSRWSYCHLNSVQQLPDGNLLVSLRHTSGVYLIDKRTGKIIWTLGGKYSSFKLGPGARFSWQHDPRLHGTLLTVFDNGWDGVPGDRAARQSSAKTLRLNTSTMTATLVHRYTHDPPVLSAGQGSAQALPDGGVFVGWGAAPEFSEYTSSGRQIFTGSLPFGVESYRAFRFRWTARPLTPPSLGLSRLSRGRVTVYASWNGATAVASWRVLGGPSPSDLKQVGAMPRTGFESAVTLQRTPTYVEAQALDSSGRVLGTSVPRRGPT